MECAKDQCKPEEMLLQGAWDRLVLVLLSEPREGYEKEYKNAVDREISRLAVLCCHEQGAPDE